MKNERGALHLEVLCALPGRLRVRLEKPVDCSKAATALPGVRECRFNERVGTLLCLFDEHAVDVETLIARLAAVYARKTGAALLHIKRSEEPGFRLPPSGALALGCIAADGVLTLAASPLTRFSRWLSAGATLAARHRARLCRTAPARQLRPEVMSVVYLINAIGKENGVRASLVAWVLTFGRHLIPHAPREQVYLVHNGVEKTTLTPLRGGGDGKAFAASLLQRGAEMMLPRASKSARDQPPRQ